MSPWVSDRALRLALILSATIGALVVLYVLAMVVFIGSIFLGMGWSALPRDCLKPSSRRAM